MNRPLGLCAATALAIVVALVGGTATARDQKGTRVKPGAATRVFVVAGFDAACKPVEAVDLSVSRQPKVGTVSFERVGATTVQYSVSGRCIGSRQPGFGVFYKAPAGGRGLDQFEITAKVGRNQVATRTITVAIAED